MRRTARWYGRKTGRETQAELRGDVTGVSVAHPRHRPEKKRNSDEDEKDLPPVRTKERVEAPGEDSQNARDDDCRVRADPSRLVTVIGRAFVSYAGSVFLQMSPLFALRPACVRA